MELRGEDRGSGRTVCDGGMDCFGEGFEGLGLLVGREGFVEGRGRKVCEI